MSLFRRKKEDNISDKNVKKDSSDKSKVSKSRKKSKKSAVKISPFAHILLGPVVTEKAYTLSDMDKYVFYVKTDATKRHVRRAVQDIYGVTVEAVHVIKMSAQGTTFRGIKGKTKNKKKAIVTLSKGEKIDLFG